MPAAAASPGVVAAVAKNATHAFSKPVCESIALVAGLGVEGDAHQGRTVKHRSRVAVDPTQPNLRQVHLIHEELLEELTAQGFRVGPGVLGENITTRGVDLLGLSRGARLAIGADAVVEITGLRNPCGQLDVYQDGLLRAVLDRAADGALIRKAGIMGVVVAGGVVRGGDTIAVTPPDGPRIALDRV